MSERPLFGDAIGPWHAWFAWRPVRTYDNRWKWLCIVLRRNIQKHQHLDGGPDFWWQYKVAFDFPLVPNKSSDLARKPE